MPKKKTKPFSEKGINSTKNKLKGTPFSTAEELKKAQQGILEETWRRLEKARTKQELIKKEEYAFFIEIFRQGMVCMYGEQNNNLVRISLSKDKSITISISEEMKTKEKSEHLLGVLIESMSSSFLANYLKAMDIVEDDPEVENQIRRLKKRLQNQI